MITYASYFAIKRAHYFCLLVQRIPEMSDCLEAAPKIGFYFNRVLVSDFEMNGNFMQCAP